MRANNVQSWKYNEKLEMLLFFAQRMDELLFHHTTDSYRYPVMSIISLCAEYIRTYDNDNISDSNLNFIVNEIIMRFSEDTCAINILTEEYKERFIKQYGHWNNREKYENILYMYRKLSGRKYLNEVITLLKKCINQNNEKRLVDRYSAILIRLLIDEGYDENFIYKNLHEIFFHEKVDSVQALESFINRFTFENQKYDVYIGFSQDLSRIIPLFKKITTDEIDITNMDLKNLPSKIRSRGQKTILKFSNVIGLDLFSAYESVKRISTVIVNSYNYYTHSKTKIKIYGHVIDRNCEVISISEQDLLKNRVSALSFDESQKMADEMLQVTFSGYNNFDKIQKITEIHNSAIYSNNISDSLLALWSILESLCPKTDEKEDKIARVKKYLLPFLKSTYIEKIVITCMEDIRRWDEEFFKENILEHNKSLNPVEATYAFLVLDDMEECRKKLYQKCELFPLLRYRVFFLNAQLKNTKGYKSIIEAHVRRVEWQLHRIYRARNYIIHDSRREDEFNMDLLVNLHSYVDLMFGKMIHLLIDSPFAFDDIDDIVVEHKLKTEVMEEILEKTPKMAMSPDIINKYLYYDFEK